MRQIQSYPKVYMKNNEHDTPQEETILLEVQESDTHKRIDTFMHEKLPHYSRSFFQQLLKSNHISRNNEIVTKASLPVNSGDNIQISFPKHIEKDEKTVKSDLESLPVHIIGETDQFLVLNKPAGLLVHNTTSDPLSTTLVDWIKIYRPTISMVGDPDRPGIVHRLDRNTSGIMLVAKTDAAYAKLSQLFKDRKIKKFYRAIVKGDPDKQGSISFPIGRHPVHRHKMTAYKPGMPLPTDTHVRQAQSAYRVLEYYPHATYIEITPTTGRTHQIRVHMNAIGHPIVGDHIYGSSSLYIPRHALHAHTLTFEFDGTPYHFTCSPPKDFLEALSQLRNLGQKK